MIEIFKTTVHYEDQSTELLTILQRLYPNTSFTFDLEDCDKILRAEIIEPFEIAEIIKKLNDLGFGCEVLEG